VSGDFSIDANDNQSFNKISREATNLFEKKKNKNKNKNKNKKNKK